MTFIIRVFIESKSETLQAADMDTVGHPGCTRTNATDWANGSLGKGGNMIPQEHQILLDAASRAAKKLDCHLEIIDVSEYSFWHRLRSKGVIPRIEIGDEILTGLPTSDEIVKFTTQHSIAKISIGI